ncbi:unnamed protein product [Cladocopium goreaui]|uniref:GP-PDE domain-containing protein n=1 Tax=Cladocopium goreaui TaxID=2562237 RepID=A0A9P1DQY8_9DINO|nr:unnamed protein product [Cladocopium goreaui]|mmetsp:Transcript_5945/g.13579  ORF Transcript_5945/g.13579 Transcript_5945/m.13579 type:complete len:318 (+) Transcript_5945:65-1018(+)
MECVVPLLTASEPLMVAHRCGGGEAPENTLESIRYCLNLKVPLIQLDVMHTKDEKVVLFHDVPVERNMEKLTGVTGQIGDFNYSELPVFKAEFQPNAFCPEDAPPVKVNHRQVSLFEDACKLLAGKNVGIILEFWQESESLVLHVVEMLRRHGLLNQIAAWGSPEKVTIQSWCRTACPEIPVLITLAQAFRVWTCWNLGFHCIGSLGRWLPFLVQGPMVFNVPHISEPWYGALCKFAKTDSHSRSVKTCIIGSLLCLLKCWTDTPRLFLHLATRYNVPTILFIANDSTSVKKCCSYKGVNAVQTDYPKKFMPIFQHT